MAVRIVKGLPEDSSEDSLGSTTGSWMVVRIVLSLPEVVVLQLR